MACLHEPWSAVDLRIDRFPSGQFIGVTHQDADAAAERGQRRDVRLRGVSRQGPGPVPVIGSGSPGERERNTVPDRGKMMKKVGETRICKGRNSPLPIWVQ